jgi:GT2 family glycosyltransferase
VSEKLTVVIPASDRRASLGGAMLAVAAAAEPAEEVLVIETAGAGPAAARNEGAERASGDILVFIDSDVEIAPDSLARIRRAFRDDPGLTAVFGSYDDRPPFGDVGSRFRNLLHHHIHQQSAGPATTFWAGLGAIRREAFMDAGGFDAERYPGASMEDIELGMRITAAGGRIVLDPWLRGTHMKQWPVSSMLRTDFWRRGTPWVRLLVRRRELSSALNLSWRHRTSALLSVHLLWSLVSRRPARAAGALAAFMALNHGFHALLWNRAGARTGVLGIPLHLLHHLTGVGAAITGCCLELATLMQRVAGSKEPSTEREPLRPQEEGAYLPPTREARPSAAAPETVNQAR